MRKQQKMMTFDADIMEFLDTAQPNASALVQDLIYAEMKRINDLKKDKKPLDISTVHTAVILDAEALLKKEEERLARNKAWDLLDLDVKEEIKDTESWGVKWKEIFYPMVVKNGGTLSVKEVRDWYFANKEGFKL